MEKGSITKYNGKNGTSYHIRICTGYDSRGYPIQRGHTVHGTKRDAEAKLRELLTEVDRGVYVNPDNITLSEFIPKWFKSHKVGLSPTTVRRYRDFIDSHIIPQLGSYKIQKLSTLRIQEFVDYMLECGNRCSPGRGLSAKSVRDCILLLKQALRQAAEWKILSKNPTDGIRLPASKPKEIQVLTEQGAEKVLNSLENTYGYMPAFISYHTGMRLGEVLGLSWDCVDFKKKTIQVKRSYTIQDKSGSPILKEPKTRAGRRIVEIGNTLAFELLRHRKAQLKKRLEKGSSWNNKFDLLCTQEGGEPISSRAIGHLFSRRARALGYDVTFHGLRHTHVSMLIKAGVPINAISARIGHSSPSITHNIYAHLLPGMGRDAVKRFEDMLAR